MDLSWSNFGRLCVAPEEWPPLPVITGPVFASARHYGGQSAFSTFYAVPGRASVIRGCYIFRIGFELTASLNINVFQVLSRENSYCCPS